MPEIVTLRNVIPDDLPILFQNQLDADSNRMAFMRPHSRADFDIHWDRILKDAKVTVKAVVVGDRLSGCISSYPMEGLTYVGYWIAKPFWGRGIATRALQLLLADVSERPLHARVATANIASLRVLEKCGFSVIAHEMSPDTERLVACEEAILELG